MTVEPSGMVTSRPSTVSLGMHGLRAANIRFELVAELGDVRLNGPRRRVGKDADGLAFHVAGDGEQIIQILPPALARGDPVHDAIHPARALPARRALPA